MISFVIFRPGAPRFPSPGSGEIDHCRWRYGYVAASMAVMRAAVFGSPPIPAGHENTWDRHIFRGKERPEKFLGRLFRRCSQPEAACGISPRRHRYHACPPGRTSKLLASLARFQSRSSRSLSVMPSAICNFRVLPICSMGRNPFDHQPLRAITELGIRCTTSRRNQSLPWAITLNRTFRQFRSQRNNPNLVEDPICSPTIVGLPPASCDSAVLGSARMITPAKGNPAPFRARWFQISRFLVGLGANEAHGPLSECLVFESSSQAPLSPDTTNLATHFFSERRAPARDCRGLARLGS